MSEEVNNLPALNNTPEELEAERDKGLFDEVRSYLLDPTIDYPEPHFMFEFNGVGFSPLGGIQAMSGQKKNGKTFVLSQLIAVALGSGTERVETYLPGLTTCEATIEHLGHEPRVLYCDTEMELLYGARVLRRVHWLCNWDMKARSDRFYVLRLREMKEADNTTVNNERWRVIKNAIHFLKPDIVFIDGLRDIVNDFNDNKESSQIVGEMMSLASRMNICIWSVLHMNPRPGNDDESKMRGHLGTELGNKVSDTFISTKKKDADTGKYTYTVRQEDARSKPVDDWKFVITDDAGMLGIPMIIANNVDEQPDKPIIMPDDILHWIDFADDDDTIQWPLSKSEIKEIVFGKIGGVKYHTAQNDCLKMALVHNLFIESDVKVKGHPKLMINPDRPFSIEDDDDSIRPNGRANERYKKDADTD